MAKFEEQIALGPALRISASKIYFEDSVWPIERIRSVSIERGAGAAQTLFCGICLVIFAALVVLLVVVPTTEVLVAASLFAISLIGFRTALVQYFTWRLVLSIDLEDLPVMTSRIKEDLEKTRKIISEFRRLRLQSFV